MRERKLSSLSVSLLLALIGSLSVALGNPEQIVEGEPIVLQGIVQRVTFPLTEDDKGGSLTGSSVEHYCLVTARPLDFSAPDEDGGKLTLGNQMLFQLFAMDDGVRSSLESAVGKRVTLEAEAMRATTRYHRTPVLLEVKSFRIGEAKKSRPDG